MLIFDCLTGCIAIHLSMIAYLSGLILDKTEKSLIFLVSGVGYEVFVTTAVLAESKLKQDLQIFIHTAVKEDDISLYGFKLKEELAFYRKLLTVSGIGPRMGMEILGAPLNMVKNAILSEDLGTLTKIKGLGKKTAERLCLELKNKIEMTMDHEPSHAQAQGQEDAIMALESLGYERYHILKFMAQLPPEIEGTEEIVKYFLKHSS